jgi:hypothetical protein
MELHTCLILKHYHYLQKNHLLNDQNILNQFLMAAIQVNQYYLTVFEVHVGFLMEI